MAKKLLSLLLLFSVFNPILHAQEKETFIISKTGIGPIQLGMDVPAAEIYLKHLKKVETEAWFFGYDGGGSAYMYTLDGVPYLVLIPAYESDSIIAIVALHQSIATPKGIRPGMTVEALLKIIPYKKVDYNPMSEWEEIYDLKNGWVFVLENRSSQNAGKYNYEKGLFTSRIYHTHLKILWILIH